MTFTAVRIMFHVCVCVSCQLKLDTDKRSEKRNRKRHILFFCNYYVTEELNYIESSVRDIYYIILEGEREKPQFVREKQDQKRNHSN